MIRRQILETAQAVNASPFQILVRHSPSEPSNDWAEWWRAAERSIWNRGTFPAIRSSVLLAASFVDQYVVVSVLRAEAPCINVEVHGAASARKIVSMIGAHHIPTNDTPVEQVWSPCPTTRSGRQGTTTEGRVAVQLDCELRLHESGHGFHRSV